MALNIRTQQEETQKNGAEGREGKGETHAWQIEKNETIDAQDARKDEKNDRMNGIGLGEEG